MALRVSEFLESGFGLPGALGVQGCTIVFLPAAAATPGGFHRPNIIVAGRPSLHVLQDTFANGHLVALRDQVSLAMPVEKLAPPRGLAGCQKSFRVYGLWGQGVA